MFEAFQKSFPNIWLKTGSKISIEIQKLFKKYGVPFIQKITIFIFEINFWQEWGLQMLQVSSKHDSGI